MPSLEASLRGALVSSLANATVAPTPAPEENKWALSTCCSSKQTEQIVLVCVYSVVVLLLWKTRVLMPFKLIVVFFHELSHALACWCTGGKVVAIEVNLDEGGVTKTVGGRMSVILPAGYLGSALWGMFFVLMSTNIVTSQIAGGLLGAALLVVLYLADNNVLRGLCVFFILLTAGFWAATLLSPWDGLRYLLLFLGVMSGLFSIWDIYDDLISRRVNESDASKFAEMTHCSSRLCGTLWGLFSICFMGLGIYLSLVLLEGK